MMVHFAAETSLYFGAPLKCFQCFLYPDTTDESIVCSLYLSMAVLQGLQVVPYQLRVHCGAGGQPLLAGNLWYHPWAGTALPCYVPLASSPHH